LAQASPSAPPCFPPSRVSSPAASMVRQSRSGALATAALTAATAALCGSASAKPLRLGELRSRFERYLSDFGKTYEHLKEREARFEAFTANYLYIEEENAKGLSYQLGVNEFTDMTPDEFALTHFGLKKPAGDLLWSGLPYLGQHQRSNITLAESVDWTTKGAVTTVKNQAQCGSCWAFSTTGALEGAWEIATGKLVSVSEQQLVDCSRKFGEQGCSGGMMDGGFQYAETTAMCSEASYPYEAKNGICRANATQCKVAIPKGGVVGFKDVKEDDEEALMDAVSQQPVSVAIEADEMAFQMYHSGVLTGKCGARLDHGVLAVGYGMENGTKYWLVKNSWGPTWGVHGFVKVLRGKKGPGECGIKMNPSYPVVKAVATGSSQDEALIGI